MRILVTGSAGQLGLEFLELLKEDEVYACDLEGTAASHILDITDLRAVNQAFDEAKPDIVLHPAAYTDVDGCQQNPDLAYKVNAVGTQNIALACQAQNIPCLYVSTDYVFDGQAIEPYSEFDDPAPQSIYGRSKLAGERYIQSLLTRYYIVRTAWVYGQGKNFVRTMIALGQEKPSLKVVDDQIGSPTYSKDLASKCIEIVKSGQFGLYHVTNQESCSWYSFTKEIFKQKGITTHVEPCTTDDFPRPAPRPAYSVLKNYSLELRGFKLLRPWQEALAEYLAGE
ncbi:MAG: dTDP-4-dehydrorhamnose reductase [Actinobacteria bacterium]|nr:MAG: dTDP-4-dehydrorhamnose reductase [Actinomycetota bacterium]